LARVARENSAILSPAAGRDRRLPIFRWSAPCNVRHGPRMGLRGARVLVLATAALGTPCAACGSPLPSVQPEDPGGCQAYVPPSTFSPTSPTVTFSADVMPIVLRSCAFASCHGSESGPTGGMYLGADEEATYENIVNVPSNDVPTMMRVKPGDPANSFLQHKIDGDACTVAACSATCAELMPQGQDLMAVNDRLTVRAWIAQGAPSDIPGFDAGLGTEQ
jgi:hypothetical protein